MVRLGSSLALLAASALPLAQAGPISALYSTGDSVVRYGLRNFLRLNETQIDRVLRNENTPIDPHPFARDLTDEDYETILATGTDNAFAPVLPSDDVWVITVFGTDPVSKPCLEAMNNVSLRHSHEAGGSLPAKLHFARLNYARETVLTTRFWLWRTPVIVIGTDGMRTLRFLQPGHVRPDVEELVELFSKPQVWQQLPPWTGMLAPGGFLEPYILRLALIWARIHKVSSKLPSMVLLAFSGFIMNFAVSWFHKNDDQLQKNFAKRAAEERNKKAAEGTKSGQVTASSSATPAKSAGRRK
ncbi:hypothetical protein JCM8202_004840 [Rhodotorula sphaerocarpa]